MLFMAPELLNNFLYSKPVDIWSCGITLYMLLHEGRHPLYNKSKDTKKTLKEKLLNPEKNWNFGSHISDLAKDLFHNVV